MPKLTVDETRELLNGPQAGQWNLLIAHLLEKCSVLCPHCQYKTAQEAKHANTQRV